MAVTVTYEYPIAGTTAPTAAQAGVVNAVNANIIATADADTTATITHNLNISAADIAAGWPQIELIPLLQAPAAVSEWAVTSITTNTIVLTKGTGVGSGNAGAQLRVQIARPHSLVR